MVYAAMGGSAAAGRLAAAWPGLRVPLEMVQGYEIPAYVGPQTLFVTASYSGNTEETLEAVSRAAEAGARIAVLAGGGELVALASERGYPLAILPETRQPRFAAFSNFVALITLLAQAGLCSVDRDELAAAAEFLRAETENWLPTVPAAKNLAKQIARECMGRSAVLYSGPKLAPAVHQWKIAINESAKQVAWQGVLPEFNHNEFTGWSKQPEQKPYAVIELRSRLEHPRIQKRFELTERLLSGLRPAPVIVDAKGDTVLQQLVWASTLGDFVGVYLALLNGLDPTALPLVGKLKRALQD
ncbi:MAG TPA: SIS domain-containing protein [Candidatus Saccharimonadales bacterium]